MSQQQKYVLVTGVSGGIGKALVDLYLSKGYVVAGFGRNAPLIDSENFYFYSTDVRKKENLEKSLASFMAVSKGKLDVVINNAGVGYFGLLESYDESSIQAMFETNVYGLIYLNQLVAPIMKHQNQGHIFNISSIAGLDAFPQVSIYCATKHAVRGLSESMYKELREFGVKVTCVYPGSVKTDFFRNIDSIEPNNNMLMPEDVATMIYQASETSPNFHQVNLEIRPLQPKGKNK